MQAGRGFEHGNHHLGSISFDAEKYRPILKYLAETQADETLRDCKKQTFSPEMQLASPCVPLAVLVLILGDIINYAQDEVVLHDFNDSHNSLALVIFAMQMLDLYSHYSSERSQHPSDWFAAYAEAKKQTTEQLWTSMKYAVENITIDKLNIDNLRFAAVWFNRFYNELVGRYNVIDSAQKKRASQNIRAAAGLKQVAEMLQKKISLAYLSKKELLRDEHPTSKLISGHKERVAAAFPAERLQIIGDLPLIEIISVIKSYLLALSQKDNAAMIPLLLKILTVPFDEQEDESLTKALFRNMQQSFEEFKPLTVDSLKRMKANAVCWVNLQLWLIGAAESIKVLNSDLKSDCLHVFATLNLVANYIHDAVIKFYGDRLLPEYMMLAGNRTAAIHTMDGLYHLYHLHLSKDHNDQEKLKATIQVLRIWHRLIGEFYARAEDKAMCHHQVQIKNKVTLDAVNKLGLAVHYQDFMTAQHVLLNLVHRLHFTDDTLTHWAALAARFKVLTFDTAATDALRVQLCSLYTVIGIALQKKVEQYQASQRERHSPLLSHHLHASPDTGHDLPEYAECNLEFEFLSDPIICVLDGRSYSPMIIDQLRLKKKAPMNNAELQQLCPTQVLYPNVTLRKLLACYKANDVIGMNAAVACPLLNEPMLDAVFCRLDNQTYSRRAITTFLESNRKTPGDRPVCLAQDQLISEVLCDDYNIQEAVRCLYPELKPNDAAVQLHFMHQSSDSGCCRIL